MILALNILSALAALASAALWFRASKLPIVYPMAYLSGPPVEIEQILHKQARCNAVAAIATGVAVLLQGAATLMSALSAPAA